MDGGEWFVLLQVVALGCLTVAATVLLHFEALALLDRRLFREQRAPRRLVVLTAVFALLALHSLHVLLYGATFWWISLWDGGGVIDAAGSTSFLDAAYLSALNYSTLGLGGDLSPVGPLRLLVAVESMAGLLMITWSASFSYHRFSRRFGDHPSAE